MYTKNDLEKVRRFVRSNDDGLSGDEERNDLPIPALEMHNWLAQL